MKLVTSSNPSPSSDIGVVLTATLFLRTLLLPLWTDLRTGWSIHNCAGLFLHVSLDMGEGSQIICKAPVIKLGPRSPLISMSLLSCGCLQTQSMASRTRKGDNRHPCLTPVFTWKASVSWRPQIPACHSTVGVSNYACDLIWYAIVSLLFPEFLLIQTVQYPF